jgi:hypothetical protein
MKGGHSLPRSVTRPHRVKYSNLFTEYRPHCLAVCSSPIVLRLIMLITVLTILQAWRKEGREGGGNRRLVTNNPEESAAVSSFLHICRFAQNAAPSR